MSVRATDTKPCENCRKPFPVGGRRPRKPRTTRFCSHACAGAARKNRRPCLQCGSPVKPPKKFCSRECWKASHDHTHNLADFTCDRCGKSFKRWPSQRMQRSPSARVYCSGECRAAGRVYATGEQHPQWKGGPTAWRYIDAAGYVHIGPSLEHRLVMERILGRSLERHESVHHINGQRGDNRPENLQLRSGAHGKGVVLACADCGSHNVVRVAIADPH